MAQESDRPADSSKSQESPRSFHAAPSDWTALYDSNLRLALALIKAKDWVQLAARTGIECSSPEPQFLSLFVEIDRDKLVERETNRFDIGILLHFELLVPSIYLKEFAVNPALRTLAVRIHLDSNDPSLTIQGTPVEELLKNLSTSGFVSRVRIAVAHGKNLERSLAALDLPPAYVYDHHHLTGEGIVIGIIDDGCAFAHPDFLRIVHANGTRTYQTRVLALWDQVQSATVADKASGWVDPADFDYGRELSKAAIDAVLGQHSSPAARSVAEDAVYAALRYEVGSASELATHGTKVMGIAAGNGHSLLGHHGVAPRADIIFVQLPPEDVRHAPKLLSDKIVHGAAFIFQRARDLGKKAAVVNISYGGYSGPHDGTSGWELAIDELLHVQDRAVVVSAGNAFEADCHAMATVPPASDIKLRWIMNPGDTTGNDLELWYNGDAALELSLESPDGAQAYGPYPFGPHTDIVRVADNKIIGSVEHVQTDATNGDNSILLALGATALDAMGVTGPLALAPPGAWVLRLHNAGKVPASFHGWIQRDDLGREGAKQQSRFVPDDAHPGCTIGDFATGKLSIAAGAFNAATNEVSAYSSCGPTRSSLNNPSRRKPDFCAPAEELALGGGVLTTASRQGTPRRMNGTSAAAPHVAGIVALVFDYQRNHQNQHLTAAELRAVLSAQTGGQPLVPNRRSASHQRKVKQADVWNDLIGAGRISCLKTLDKL